MSAAILLGVMPVLLMAVITVAVAKYWRPGQHASQPWLLFVAVGVALGISVDSSLFLLWKFSLGATGAPFVFVESVVLAVVAMLLWRKRNRDAGSGICAPPQPAKAIELFATALLVFTIFFALSAAWRYGTQHPHGQWDAWAMWNLKARFLYGADGMSWAAMFTQGATPHTDYPLLQPAAVARIWSVLGEPLPAAPRVIGLVALVVTALVVAGAVTLLRGRFAGCAAGSSAIALPVFIRESATQYADTTLAMFLVAAMAVVSVALHSTDTRIRNRGLVIAGVLAGSAAWTKNEGLAFALAGLVALAIGLRTSAHRRETVAGVRCYAIGLAPFLVLVVAVKFLLSGTATTLAAWQPGDWIERLTDPQRYHDIATMIAFLGRGVMDPVMLLLIALFVIVGRWSHDRQSQWVVLMCAGWLAGLLLAYAWVYLTTSNPLSWRLTTSADRLVVQVWPGLILTLFLAARSTASANERVTADGPSA